MSDHFKPGQTVHHMGDSHPWTVIHQHEEWVWVERDDALGSSLLLRATNLTTTSPSQPAEPQFKLGQTVWNTINGEKAIFCALVRGQYGDIAWLRNHDGYFKVSIKTITATDPNQSAEPQWKKTFAAPDWAKEFCRIAAKKYGVHLDDAWVMGWFANALMFGFDERARRDKVERENVAGAWLEASKLPTKVADQPAEPTPQKIEDGPLPGQVEAEQIEAILAINPHARPDDNKPLTEEWLRKMGLYDGDSHLAFRGITTRCKTIGDARQLCRLLGVPLVESTTGAKPNAAQKT